MVKKLIKKVGGYMKVASDLKISEATVKRWAYLNKIPVKYWKYFMDEGELDVKDLYNLFC